MTTREHTHSNGTTVVTSVDDGCGTTIVTQDERNPVYRCTVCGRSDLAAWALHHPHWDRDVDDICDGSRPRRRGGPPRGLVPLDPTVCASCLGTGDGAPVAVGASSGAVAVRAVCPDCGGAGRRTRAPAGFVPRPDDCSERVSARCDCGAVTATGYTGTSATVAARRGCETCGRARA